MKANRITLSTFFATLILLLAACSQPTSIPDPNRAGAQAGTTTTISDEASCLAAGGYFDDDECDLEEYTVAAGDTLRLFGTVTFEEGLTINGTLETGQRSFIVSHGFSNTGTINLRGTLRVRGGTSVNSGTINILSFGYLDLFPSASLTNNGTIKQFCGGAFSNSGTYSGNPVQDACPPSVKVEKASSQADPTSASPIHFTATFSESVTGFGASHVTLSGTAGATKATVSEIAPNNGTTYDIAVSGITTDGTVGASILADQVADAAGNKNTASSGTNTVNFIADFTAPTAAPTQSPAANSEGWNNSDVTVNWNWSDAGSGIDSANCTTSSASSGEGSIKLSATCKDKAGNEGSAEYTVKVDKTAPKCTVTVNPASLWAPNHKLTNITTTVSVLDTNPDGFVLKSVSSSEADSGLGTDDVPGDIQGWTLNTADTAGQLRSERYSKNGRTYTFTYEAKDKAGNTGTCTASVSVPKSQGK